MSDLSPAERKLRAQIAAHTSWANTEDRRARTAAGTAAFLGKFERQVDPDGTLDPSERARRAESARKAHFARLAFLSAQARRKKGTPDTVTGLTLEERVERMEAMRGEIATHLGLTSPAGHADMGDPLAPFRLPDGSVAYLSIPVGGLRAGDWFQRQRGDDGWHQVRPLIFGGDQVGVPFDETGLEWFGRDQMVRVARTPEHVVAAQERRWETGR